MTAPRALRVTALLARGPGQPNGDIRCGIELTVCLTPSGHLNPGECETLPGRVRRFWRDRPDWQGILQRIDENRWGLQAVDNPDEPLRELEATVVRPGAYLILRRPNAEELVFRVVSVEDA
jgi:hypothetical protein